jgi:tetratricopeptide (TPR) repeat protein/predicted esterase
LSEIQGDTVSQLHRITDVDVRPQEPVADVVFIHGLGGDARGTWRHGQTNLDSWPHWVAADFPQVAVWSLGYAASPTRLMRVLKVFGLGDRDSGHAMSLPDRAGQVLDRLLQKGVGQRPVVFVCHSLGGLLVKHVLRKSSDAGDAPKGRLAASTRGVLFLATPHNGAVLASLLNELRTVLGTTVSIADLREHDAHLRDLFNWYRRAADQRGIRTVTYYESRSVLGVLPIVNPTSAHPGVGEDPVELDEDHLSIAKPRERDSQVCDALAAMVREHLLGSETTPVWPVDTLPSAPRVVPEAMPMPIVVQVQLPQQVAAPPRAPRELPPRAARFFGRATQRQGLADRMRRGRSTAVVGPGGMGKTALAAEVLAELAGEQGERLAATCYPDGIVYLDLYALRGNAPAAWSSLANRLSGAAFMDRSPPRERAVEACRGRALLLVIEGGEEADGLEGRAAMGELLEVLSPENRLLLLTRLSTQYPPAESILLRETLDPDDAAALFDSLTAGVAIEAGARSDALALLDGHPLALNWAGNLLSRDDEEPAALVKSWRDQGLPSLSDPTQSEHTLRWLFGRSTRGLGALAMKVLWCLGKLAPAPVDVRWLSAGLAEEGEDERGVAAGVKALINAGLLRRVDGGQVQCAHALVYRFAGELDGPGSLDRFARLAKTLGEVLRAELSAQPVSAAAWPAIARDLQHAAALLRADAEHGLWAPLVNPLLYEIHGHLDARGTLDLRRVVADAVAGWLAPMADHPDGTSFWPRERAVSLTIVGDVLRAQGDLAGALNAFKASRHITERLADASRSDDARQRDLSISLNRIGEVQREQGDLAGALETFQASRAIREHLVEAAPSNDDRQRDLGVILTKVGAVLREQGDLDGALDAFQASRVINKRLADADGADATKERDLSVCHNNVGEVLQAQGKLADALEAFQASRAIIERVAGADRSNTGWQRDVSISLNNVGNVLAAQGELAAALEVFKASQAIRERLADADRSNVGWQSDISVSLNNVGNVLRMQGDLVGALEKFSASKVISERLANADRSNARWQRDLSYLLTLIAQCHEQGGALDDALENAAASLAIDEHLTLLDPSNATWRNDVTVSRRLVRRLRAARDGG